MRNLFSLDMPAPRVLRNTLIVSLMGLTAMLPPYVALTPGFGAMLAQGGPALSRFLRQILTNGLPVVFAVNYAGFFLVALNADRAAPGRIPKIMLFDIPVRLTVFVVLHILIYVPSADWFGSFGGSQGTALRVVAPTLARSAFFENLSGVYLYASLISALPVHGGLILRSGLIPVRGNSASRYATAVILAALWAGLALVILTVLASGIADLQQE